MKKFAVLALFATQFIVSTATAAERSDRFVDDDGIVALNLIAQFNLSRAPTTNEADTFEQEIRAANRILWDASDGQIRINKVDVYTTTDGSDNTSPMATDPDIRVENGTFAPRVFPGPEPGSLDENNPPMESAQSSDIKMAIGTLTSRSSKYRGQALAHEIGHYAFGLGDEYSAESDSLGGSTCEFQDQSMMECEQELDNYGNGYAKTGPCMEMRDHAQGPKEHCIMQRHFYGTPPSIGGDGTPSSEFCIHDTHDKTVGCGQEHCCSGGSCPGAGGSNYRYTTGQTSVNDHSCWRSIANQFSVINEPTESADIEASPATNPPAVDIESDYTGEEARVFILDRSGSMGRSISASVTEVCDNGEDDDVDGVCCETGCPSGTTCPSGTEKCKLSRRSHLASKYSAEILSQAIPKKYSKYAALTFADSPTQKKSFDLLIHSTEDPNGSGNYQSYQDVATNMSIGGNTGIGRALSDACDLLQARHEPRKSVYLYTDGHNNVGPDPIQVAQECYDDHGVVTNVVGSFDAANTEEVDGIGTGKAFVDEDGRHVSNMMRRMILESTGWVPVIPREPFRVNAEADESTETIAEGEWFSQDSPFLGDAPTDVQENVFEFWVPKESNGLAVGASDTLLSGDDYAVEVELIGPSSQSIHLDPGNSLSRLTVVSNDTTLTGQLDDPESGKWEAHITPKNGVEFSRGDFHAHVMTNPHMEAEVVGYNSGSNSVEIRVVPYNDYRMDGASVWVRKRGPNGGLFQAQETDKGGEYIAEVPISSAGRKHFEIQASTIGVDALENVGEVRYLGLNISPPIAPDIRMSDRLTHYVVDP